jgi:hypothetical protein
MPSEYAISIAPVPPISVCTVFRASYIDWLKAMSLMALGITTATRKGVVAAGVPAPPHAAANNRQQSLRFHMRRLLMFLCARVE